MAVTPLTCLSPDHLTHASRNKQAESSQLSQRFGPGLSLLLIQPTYTFRPCIRLDLLPTCLLIHPDPALPFASSASEILHCFSAALWWLCSLSISSSNICSRSLTWSFILSPERLSVYPSQFPFPPLRPCGNSLNSVLKPLAILHLIDTLMYKCNLHLCL